MDINSYLYSGNTSISSLLSSNATRNVQFRSGVTGWEQKQTSDPASTSGVSSEVTDYLTSVKKFGGSLNDAMNSLAGSGKTPSIFDSLGAASSDTEALTVKVSDQAQAKEFLQGGGEKQVEVFQLAAAQQNRGESLTAAGYNSVNRGGNSFSIEKGGKSYSFEVDVNGTDSNRTVQQKMADAINSENMGVKAAVQYNESTKESSLVLTSTETGEDNGFTVSDQSGGNAVREMGVSTAAREARNAHYSVDGADEYSASNEVELGDGISATLRGVTGEEAVTVNAGENQSGITNAIYNFVNSFNQLRETAAGMSDDRNAQNLQDRLDNLTSAYAGTLETAGITTNNSGYLQIDKEQMNEAIKNGDAEKALGEDSSFTKSLTSLSAQTEEDPARFLSYKTRSASESSDSALSSYNFEDMSSYNFSPYQSMQMSQWNMVGMLFSAGA